MKNKIISLLMSFVLLAKSAFPAFAQVASGMPGLPSPGVRLTISSAYHPLIIRGLTIVPDNPLQLNFIFDTGDDNSQGDFFEQESIQLIKYFLTALTVPDEDLWVNLSPYENDRVIAKGLGKTEMGRVMLSQDYLLKQLTASLMYPEDELGKMFWQRVYAKAKINLGVTDIPANIYNKIWIMPERAQIFVHDKHVLVLNSHLKVMLEEDYLVQEFNRRRDDHGIGEILLQERDVMPELVKEVIREILLPIIEQEVNDGKTFGPLRQIYHSMILATWFKRQLKTSLIKKDQEIKNGNSLKTEFHTLHLMEQYINFSTPVIIGLG
jgi:hypothetical protein